MRKEASVLARSLADSYQDRDWPDSLRPAEGFPLMSFLTFTSNIVYKTAAT
jgi:hypothetical protein